MVKFRTGKTTKVTSITYGFEAENFPWINLREDLNQTWNNLGLTDLSEMEQEGLFKLLTSSGISEQEGFNPESVLLIKATGGVPTGVYGPSIFRDGEMIILRVGDNTAEVIQSGDRLTIGNLKGKISVTAAKDSNGDEYPKAMVSFVSPDKEIFKVRISLDSNAKLSVGDLEASIISEDPIVQFLSQVPGQVLKMEKLGIGEFQVKAISSSMGKYGESYKLHLSDGQVVWAKGNTDLLLKAGFYMEVDTPVTLIITHIEEYAPGKFTVTNALRKRLPKLPESVDPVVQTLEAQVSSLEDNNQESETESDEQVGSIPF